MLAEVKIMTSRHSNSDIKDDYSVTRLSCMAQQWKTHQIWEEAQQESWRNHIVSEEDSRQYYDR